MTPEIRKMLKQDKPPLMAILRDTPEFKPAEVEVAEELIDSYLRESVRSGYHFLVAEEDGEIAGYICYGPTPLTEGTWDIYWLATARARRRRGIGGALMDAAEAEIGKAQGRLCVIETSSTPAYEATRRFHTGHGYRVVSRIPDFYAPGDDRLTLIKRLENAAI